MVLQRLTTIVLLTSSLYTVIANETAKSGDPYARVYIVPAVLVFFVGKPSSISLFAYVDSIEMQRADHLTWPPLLLRTLKCCGW